MGIIERMRNRLGDLLDLLRGYGLSFGPGESKMQVSRWGMSYLGPARNGMSLESGIFTDDWSRTGMYCKLSRSHGDPQEREVEAPYTAFTIRLMERGGHRVIQYEEVGITDMALMGLARRFGLDAQSTTRPVTRDEEQTILSSMVELFMS